MQKTVPFLEASRFTLSARQKPTTGKWGGEGCLFDHVMNSRGVVDGILLVNDTMTPEQRMRVWNDAATRVNAGEM